MTRKRKTRGALLAVALLVGAALAACDSSNIPRGGPQLPSTPAILNPSGDNTPSPSAALPAWLPAVGFGFATLDRVTPRTL